jgi:hypothetical protein
MLSAPGWVGGYIEVLIGNVVGRVFYHRGAGQFIRPGGYGWDFSSSERRLDAQNFARGCRHFDAAGAFHRSTFRERDGQSGDLVRLYV